jgi:hypothetical protein
MQNNSGGPVSYSTAGSDYAYSNPQSVLKSNFTMPNSAQPQQRFEDDDPRKPVSFSFGVTAERREEPLREEKMYSEEDEWQPSVLMLCLLCLLVLVVAGGLAAGIYFANDRKGKNRPTQVPTIAPSITPSSSPSLVPPNLICNLCGDDENGSVVTRPNFVVTVPGVGGAVTCRILDLDGQQGLISNNVCSEQVQQPSIQEACGCTASPSAAPNNTTTTTTTTTTQPTMEGNATESPDFVCPICGGVDSGISNLNGTLEFPGTGEVGTCQELQAQAEQGQISPDVCFAGSLTSAVQLNCNCVFQCNLCGTSGEEGVVGEINNPDGIIQVAGDSRTCASLLEAAAAGQISEQQCVALQPLAVDPCECDFSNKVP